MSTVLDVRRVSKTFGGVRALDDVSLELRSGEVHGLLGQNGSGKSTLIKMLSGYHAPDPGGSLAVDGRKIDLPLAPGQAHGLGIAFVHQDLGLVGELSVIDNLRVGRFPRFHRISWHRERRRVRQILDSFGLEVDPEARINSLTDIERALVAIVRAVADLQEVEGHGVLVLDEPTVHLPHDSIERLFDAMRRVAADGRAVLFVSHRLAEVLDVTDRVTVLRDGRNVGTVNTPDASEDQLIELILGSALDQVPPEATRKVNGEVVLSADSVSSVNVDDFSIELRRGECVGLTGLLGGGFAEISYLLYGAHPASGDLSIAGRHRSLEDVTPSRSIADGVVLVPANRPRDAVVGSLDVGQNVGLPLLSRHQRQGRLRLGELRNEVQTLLGDFNVRPASPERKIETLSGGNQQKAVLGKWMHLQPKVLLLHEPTQGVDVGARMEIFREIAAATERGTAVIIASCEHEDLSRLCDRVLIFRAGRVVCELEGTSVTEDRILTECYGSGVHG